MANKILYTFLAADALFVLGGGLLVAVAVISKAHISTGESLQKVAQMLLLSLCPLNAAIANAVLVFITFVISLPAIIYPDNRAWLKLHAWFVVASATFTLGLGLGIWFETLRTKSNLGVVWEQQTPRVRSLLQQRFDCCGYLNSTSPPFEADSTCRTPLIAAQKQGCVGPFSNFANNYLDVIFTADFCIVAIDVILLLCAAMVLKDRKERARYRLIDAKNGSGPI